MFGRLSGGASDSAPLRIVLAFFLSVGRSLLPNKFPNPMLLLLLLLLLFLLLLATASKTMAPGMIHSSTLDVPWNVARHVLDSEQSVSMSGTRSSRLCAWWTCKVVANRCYFSQCNFF